MVVGLINKLLAWIVANITFMGIGQGVN